MRVISDFLLFVLSGGKAIAFSEHSRLRASPTIVLSNGRICNLQLFIPPHYSNGGTDCGFDLSLTVILTIMARDFIFDDVRGGS